MEFHFYKKLCIKKKYNSLPQLKNLVPIRKSWMIPQSQRRHDAGPNSETGPSCSKLNKIK